MRLGTGYTVISISGIKTSARLCFMRFGSRGNFWEDKENLCVYKEPLRFSCSGYYNYTASSYSLGSLIQLQANHLGFRAVILISLTTHSVYLAILLCSKLNFLCRPDRKYEYLLSYVATIPPDMILARVPSIVVGGL